LSFKDDPAGYEITDITYPANVRDLIVWNVESAEAGPTRIEIEYFISGLTWEADYVIRTNPEETRAALEGYIRVTNRSGEDFGNARTRLIVGTIHLVDGILYLAERGVIPDSSILVDVDGAPAVTTYTDNLYWAWAARKADLSPQEKPKEILKQAVSEYQLYTIEGTEDLPNGWSKRLRSFSSEDVEIEVAYEYDEEKYGWDVVKFLKTRNDAEHELGQQPLPRGTYRVYREDGAGDLKWSGRHDERYVPVGEKLELNLGSDPRMVVEPWRMDLRRRKFEFDSADNVTGWEMETDWRLQVRNSRSVAVPITITRHFEGSWDLELMSPGEDVTWRKVDRHTVEFETMVPPMASVNIVYRLTERRGTRAD
jgi:hypothetical protein